MRLIRFNSDGQAAYGLLKDNTVYTLDGSPFESFTSGDAVGSIDDIELLAPCQPSKIVAIGRNYVAHAKEHQSEVPKEPLMFLKPPSAIIAHKQSIVRPPQSGQVEHEGELAVVIGKLAKNVRDLDAWAHVLGVTCANDVTARDLQRSDGQWSRAKGFDTFCPLGPWIETELSLEEIDALHIECRVNGTVRQSGQCGDMVFKIPRLIAYISAAMTLEPGDVILSGTLAGVSQLNAGDVVEVEIDRLGVLRNGVKQPES